MHHPGQDIGFLAEIFEEMIMKRIITFIILDCLTKAKDFVG